MVTGGCLPYKFSLAGGVDYLFFEPMWPNYLDLFGQSDLIPNIGHSLIISRSATAIGLFCGLLTRLVQSITALVPVWTLYEHVGLVNIHTGIILAHLLIILLLFISVVLIQKQLVAGPTMGGISK